MFAAEPAFLALCVLAGGGVDEVGAVVAGNFPGEVAADFPESDGLFKAG